MDILVPIILCFIPFITVLLLLKILVDGISIIKELFICSIILIAVIPVSVLQFFFGPWMPLTNVGASSVLIRAVILFGLIEEGIKCSTLLLFPVKKIDSKKMFWYSLLAGLFFGSFESVIYVLHAIQNASSRGELLLNMIYIRSFTSLLVHGFAAGMLGLFVYTFKKTKKVMLGAVLSPIILHGIYDFFAIMNAPLNYFSYVTILLLLVECRVYYIKAKELDVNSVN